MTEKKTGKSTGSKRTAAGKTLSDGSRNIKVQKSFTTTHIPNKLGKPKPK